MYRRLSLLAATLTVALSLLTGAKPASGQSLWIPRDGKQALMVELLRPSLEGIDAAFLSPAIFVSSRLAFSSNFTFVGEIPYSHHKSTQTGTDFDGNEITIEESSSTIGNIYLGVEGAVTSSPIFGELGVRIPLTSEDEGFAQFRGLVSDVARWEAFYEDAVSIQAGFNLREVTPTHVAYRLRLSPTLVIPTEGGLDSELFAIYAWQIGYEGRVVRVGGALGGRVLLTENFGNLGERSTNQFEFHADFGPWKIRPGFELRLPLGELSEAVPVVLGVSISAVR